MCGIAGFINSPGMPEQEAHIVLSGMCDSIRHRGPDDEGLYVDRTVGLGMKRLSIIDIENGHQPMFADNGRFVIVYNGEVYNFKELRQALQSQGMVFKTKSDTEVVLRVYERYGVEGFPELNGIFAFAIYDKRDKKLVLCRDPIGIKPLYYFRDGNFFVFGSEIKAILQHPAVTRDIDLQSVWDYLTYEYVPAPRTMFRNVFKIPPGHYLEIPVEDGIVSVKKYWDYPLRHDDSLRESDCVARFESCFRDVVRRQMVADTPVGVLLSGGLDSTAVAAAAREVYGDGLKTFCVGFKEGTLTDETVYARETAGFLGTDHYEYIASAGEYLDFIRDFVYLMDEPNADMAAIGKHFACRLASRHVKVVLSGEGGDEMLCGYRFDEAMRRLDQLRMVQRLPKYLARDIPVSLFDSIGLDGFARRWERVFVPLRERAQFALPCMTKRFGEEQKRALFKDEPSGIRESLDVLRDDFRAARSLEPLTQIQYAWSKQWLAEHLLMQADRMSMGVSLELRVPLLDLELVKFLFSVPDRMKVKKVNGKYRTKYLLRRFLENRVPAQVLTRPKRGFQIPNIRFIQVDLASEIRRSLLGDDSELVKFMERDVISGWIERSKRGVADMSYQKVWILYMLEMWLRKWVK